MKEADWTDPSNPTHSGRTLESIKGILSEFTKYYTSLFADKHTDPLSKATQDCLDTLSRPDPDGKTRRVLQPTADLCDAPILAHEISDIINALPNGKTPGPDRLPCRFYKTFSTTISLILQKVFEESATHQELPDSYASKESSRYSIKRVPKTTPVTTDQYHSSTAITKSLREFSHNA